MTAPDPAWVEAGAKALVAGKTYGGWIHDEDAWRAATGIAEKVIAAIEPMIREQIAAEIETQPIDAWGSQAPRGPVTFARYEAILRSADIARGRKNE